ncbi:hypothetical protein ADUPG1_009779, partial [Aduncisulcus paluster]
RSKSHSRRSPSQPRERRHKRSLSVGSKNPSSAALIASSKESAEKSRTPKGRKLEVPEAQSARYQRKESGKSVVRSSSRDLPKQDRPDARRSKSTPRGSTTTRSTKSVEPMTSSSSEQRVDTDQLHSSSLFNAKEHLLWKSPIHHKEISTTHDKPTTDSPSILHSTAPQQTATPSKSSVLAHVHDIHERIQERSASLAKRRSMRGRVEEEEEDLPSPFTTSSRASDRSDALHQSNLHYSLDKDPQTPIKRQYVIRNESDEKQLLEKEKDQRDHVVEQHYKPASTSSVASTMSHPHIQREPSESPEKKHIDLGGGKRSSISSGRVAERPSQPQPTKPSAFADERESADIIDELIPSSPSLHSLHKSPSSATESSTGSSVSSTFISRLRRVITRLNASLASQSHEMQVNSRSASVKMEAQRKQHEAIISLMKGKIENVEDECVLLVHKITEERVKEMSIKMKSLEDELVKLSAIGKDDGKEMRYNVEMIVKKAKDELEKIQDSVSSTSEASFFGINRVLTLLTSTLSQLFANHSQTYTSLTQAIAVKNRELANLREAYDDEKKQLRERDQRCKQLHARVCELVEDRRRSAVELLGKSLAPTAELDFGIESSSNSAPPSEGMYFVDVDDADGRGVMSVRGENVKVSEDGRVEGEEIVVVGRNLGSSSSSTSPSSSTSVILQLSSRIQRLKRLLAEERAQHDRDVDELSIQLECEKVSVASSTVLQEYKERIAGIMGQSGSSSTSSSASFPDHNSQLIGKSRISQTRSSYGATRSSSSSTSSTGKISSRQSKVVDSSTPALSN